MFAFAGRGSAAVAECWRAWPARRRRRERVGIETRCRRVRQARAWTTSQSPADGRLLEGGAHVLRQVWARRAGDVARARRRRPTDWVGDLPFADVSEALVTWLRGRLPVSGPGDGAAKNA